MPPELRDSQRRDDVVGARVEFEVQRTSDGKLRARRLVLLSGDRYGGPPPGSNAPRNYGRITKYEEKKGYGFIRCPTVGDNVFFLRSMLPKELGEVSFADLKDREVTFELHSNEDGKPRAHNLQLLTGGSEDHQRPTPSSSEAPAGGQPEVCTGTIVRFEPMKGYGFITPDDGREDAWFQRSEMPANYRSAQSKEEVIDLRVEFEVKTMPDGKLRALRLEILPAPGHEPDREEEHQGNAMPDLDEQAVEEFPNEHAGEAAEADEQAVDLDQDPAIPPAPQCQPQGIIRSYDAMKGFGFIQCEDCDEDVYFPRSALPETFHTKNKKDMPELVGVEVAFELNSSSERGPRADRVNLLLKWHAGDRCWLLKRHRTA